jgi:hypothetical protein
MCCSRYRVAVPRRPAPMVYAVRVIACIDNLAGRRMIDMGIEMPLVPSSSGHLLCWLGQRAVPGSQRLSSRMRKLWLDAVWQMYNSSAECLRGQRNNIIAEALARLFDGQRVMTDARNYGCTMSTIRACRERAMARTSCAEKVFWCPSICGAVKKKPWD